jgi:hypothetical protein
LSFSITQRLFQRWGRPTGDAFAGPWAHSHKAHQFFTTSPCPVGCGFDATIRDWEPLGPFVWVFPPVWLVREAIVQILRHECAAILIIPSMGRHHWPLVRQLPIQDALVVSPHKGMFQLGSHFPVHRLGKDFTCTLHCFLVHF